MSNQEKIVNFNNFLSLSDELIGVLDYKKDGEKLTQSSDSSESIFSSFFSSYSDVRSQAEDYENKITALKREIEKVKGETIPDSELLKIQNELEQKKKEEISLLEELRCVCGKLDEVEIERASLEERKIKLKEREENIVTARNVLSMSASATQILADLNDQQNISGSIVDKKKKRVETFKFQKSDNSVKICNKIWKVASVE
ncbi:hypothetical protein LUZ60_017562 [Juncus effusus]|nr:hypothetical protein LUZ60_017562 [Juncus effusus]